MRIYLLPELIIFSGLACGGPFETYQEQNNSGAEMTILSEEFRQFHTEQAKDGGRGQIEFSEPRCSETKDRPTCIAAFLLMNEQKASVVSGWMVFEMDDAGTIVSAAWVTSQPPMRIAYNAEMGQGADLATTAAGLAMGATELNPLMTGASAPVMIALKLGLPAVLKQNASVATCMTWSNSMARTGYAAAVFNVAGFALGPFALIPAVIVYAKMNDAAPGFWRCIPDDIHPMIAHGK